MAKFKVTALHREWMEQQYNMVSEMVPGRQPSLNEFFDAMTSGIISEPIAWEIIAARKDGSSVGKAHRAGKRYQASQGARDSLKVKKRESTRAELQNIKKPPKCPLCGCK